ncbi:MAG: glycosyltransferase family 2 protein [Thermoproteota archaeon]|nr:glycosyltransferase family 2 protein [Thermoproteota archaeon]
MERTVDYLENHTNWDFEIVIANDASTDKTADILESLSRLSNSIRILSWATRVGKGLSIKKAAYSCSKQYIAYMDVDLAADPSEFERLIKFIRDYDIVIGSRLIREGLPSIDRPTHRTFLSYGYSFLFRALFRVPISDPQCGFKLFKKEALLNLCNNIHNNAYVFDSELVVKARILGYRVREVPINWRHMAGSKINPGSQIISMGKDLFSLWYNTHANRSLLKRTFERQDIQNHQFV